MIRRSDEEKSKPIIFIAHSLGGIVVKDALCLSWTETSNLQEILPATLGVIFLGTPHHGSRVASLGKIAFELSKIFFQNPNVGVLRGLELNSEILERITRTFGQVLTSQRVRVHSFREELETKGMAVVDSHSSMIGHPNETHGSFYANHREMAKMRDMSDVNFQRLASVIKDWTMSPKFELHGIARPTDPVDAGTRTEQPSPELLERRYQHCLKSLNFPAARWRLEVVETAYSDTYGWLFDPDVGFTDFLEKESKDKKFWIQGKPGSGKSTLMKFALSHDLTQRYLQRGSQSPWIIAGYFFHDRGVEDVQKSIVGFLCEVLFQILRERKDLFECIYEQLELFARDPVFLREDASSQTSEWHLTPDFWALGQLKRALYNIRSKCSRDTNICLFVDALDEHDGNHRLLLSILNDLVADQSNAYFRIRLILAGRPDNVFKEALQDSPGFAIHEKTSHDIRTFAKGRIRHEIESDMTTEKGQEMLNKLLETIFANAHGVFLWVAIVVDELVEGLCEGDNVEELQQLLSEMPTELEDLYGRTLQRKKRSSTRNASDNKYETYVMFQIVLCAKTTFDTTRFFDLVSFAMVRNDSAKKSDFRVSRNELERRLYNRSAGLLERNASGIGFIHQTVKEYLLYKDGHSIIENGISPESLESGHELILAYIFYCFTYPQDDDLADWSVTLARETGYHMQMLEKRESSLVCQLLQPSLIRLTTYSPRFAYQTGLPLLSRKMAYHTAAYRVPWALIFDDYVHRPDFQLLLFYSLYDLPYSTQYTFLQMKDQLSEEDCCLILEASLMTRSRMYDLFKPGDFLMPGGPRDLRTMQALLEVGIGEKLTHAAVTFLEYLMNQQLNSFLQENEGIEINRRVMSLWTELLYTKRPPKKAFETDPENDDDMRFWALSPSMCRNSEGNAGWQ